MKLKHTPGPWYVKELKAPAALHVYAEEGGMTGISIVDKKPTARDVANARLVAAAPELLAALKFSLMEWEQYALANEPGSATEKARVKAMRLATAAIAKAEGVPKK